MRATICATPDTSLPRSLNLEELESALQDRLLVEPTAAAIFIQGLSSFLEDATKVRLLADSSATLGLAEGISKGISGCCGPWPTLHGHAHGAASEHDAGTQRAYPRPCVCSCGACCSQPGMALPQTAPACWTCSSVRRRCSCPSWAWSWTSSCSAASRCAAPACARHCAS